MSINKKKEIKKEIEFELGELDSLFSLYKKDLLEMDRTPSLIELTAMASVLHSFYSGVEKIFLVIAKKVDEAIPHDLNWHKSLLFQMAKETGKRKAVISEEMKDVLLKLLSFRHFYRHSYSSQLSWDKMESLIQSYTKNWEQFETEIYNFLNHYSGETC